MPNSMRAMLLAAGRGTRLGALGQVLPKPLVPICGYPAIAFGLAACARAGIRQVVVNLHHHGHLIRDAVGDGGAFGVAVEYSEEPELLGTGGGLARARHLLGTGPVLVMNAKVVADIDLKAVIAAHRESGAAATMVVRDDPAAREWGAIRCDAHDRIVGIRDARAPNSERATITERMFTGIQIVGPAILERLRPAFSDSIDEGYIPALEENEEIRAFVASGYFAEHSTPERYLAGNLALLREPALVSCPPGPLTGVSPDAHVADDARIIGPVRIDAAAVVEGGATVGPEVVIGARARVEAGARIARSVVWPGAIVAGSVTETVVQGS